MPRRIVANPNKIAYLRVSTDRQGDSRAGLEAQRTVIEAEIARRGWPADRVEFIEDAEGTAGTAT
jgi:DNA invertase Pin-like site-specific DNA recombinase